MVGGVAADRSLAPSPDTLAALACVFSACPLVQSRACGLRGTFHGQDPASGIAARLTLVGSLSRVLLCRGPLFLVPRVEDCGTVPWRASAWPSS
eukprot:1197935-Pyramimonas_sp.AAC.1